MAPTGQALSNILLYVSYLFFTILYNAGLLMTMIWLFETRWRVSQ